MDVYMENLKTVSNKEIYDLDAQDVLKFLIYKVSTILAVPWCIIFSVQMLVQNLMTTVEIKSNVD